MITFVVVLVGWVFSLCLHEFLHALVAYLGGDTSVREKGYLTFNPLKYTHPFYSLLLPLLFVLMGGIGLPGGAVYIETWRLRSRRWQSAVSLAGPMANLLLALALAGVLNWFPPPVYEVKEGLAFLAFLQVSALVLNLLPVPPFDGYGILAPYLHFTVREQVARYSLMITLAVFVLLWYVPVVNGLLWGFIGSLSAGMGIPLDWVIAGYAGFQFWRR